MAKMLEGLKYLYTGTCKVERHISFFSICGTVGLVNAYLALAQQGIFEISLTQKILFFLILATFCLFFTGFEILFLHERRIPDIDMRSIKLAFSQTPFIVFMVSLIGTFVALFTKYEYLEFVTSLVLATPLTMFLAGFSYNFEENEVLRLFKKFNVKDYFMLLIKLIWIMFLSYLIAYLFIFILFFIIGLVYGFSKVALQGGDVNSIILMIAANQVVIAKLSTYISYIILMYIISIGTLVWDYELIKTYEGKEE